MEDKKEEYFTMNNFPICDNCLHAIRKTSKFLGLVVNDFHKNCIKCGSKLEERVEEPSLCLDCNSKHIEKTKRPSECDQEWVKIETDDSGGEYRFEKFPMLEAPHTAIKYFSLIGAPGDHEFILNLKIKLGLSLRIEDLGNPFGTLMYKKTKFTRANEKRILNRINQKIVRWEIENNKKFLEYATEDFEKSVLYITGLTRDEFNIYDTSIIKRYGAKFIREQWGDSEFYSRNANTTEKIFKTIEIDGYALYNLNPKLREFLLNTIKESENEIRFEMGVPAIGEGWVSETSLFHQVKELCEENGIKAIHHARLNWLGLQHLDIYIPDLNLAIEYQGKQHSEPVGFFGGEEAHLKTLERDKKKKELCNQNGIELICVNEGDDINKLLADLNDRILTK
jgi:DNA-directed RNA polymerase subunit RPC12/RpoP